MTSDDRAPQPDEDGDPGAETAGRGREDFPVRWPLTTRWADNDQYGHVNNVAYYSYLDTAVNAWLIQVTGTDIRELPAIGIVAQTSCRFLSPLSFPDRLDVGIALEHVGRSSVAYRLAVFRDGTDQACAVARFVHVYVDRVTRTPVPVPDPIRVALRDLGESGEPGQT